MNEIKEDGAKAFAKGYAKNANILNDLNFSTINPFIYRQ